MNKGRLVKTLGFWPARHYFHLMINTGLGDDIAVETILHSISILERQIA